ncbi:hypothetical protein ACX3V1_20780 [Escherichia coli]
MTAHILQIAVQLYVIPVSYTHLRAHETSQDLVCRLLPNYKQKTPYEILRCLVGSEMCIRDRRWCAG